MHDRADHRSFVRRDTHRPPGRSLSPARELHRRPEGIGGHLYGKVFFCRTIFSRPRPIKPQLPSEDPTTILEDFAKHAGTLLESASSPEGKIWADAISGDANATMEKDKAT